METGGKLLLTEKDVEKIYGFTLSCLRNARCKGDGPKFIKRGSSVYYRMTDLDTWIESLKVSRTTGSINRKSI